MTKRPPSRTYNLQNRLDDNLQTQSDKFHFYFENHCCNIIVAVLVCFSHEFPHENRRNWRHARDALKGTTKSPARRLEQQGCPRFESAD